MSIFLSPNHLKNRNLDSAKAPGFDLPKQAPYYNIGPVSKVEARELWHEPKTDFSSGLGIKSPKKISVRMPNWLGDLVMATPILTDLRHQWPEAKITAICQGSLGVVIQEDPHIDEIISFPRRQQKDALLVLQKTKFDLGILLTNSFSSAYQFWKGNVKNRIGYRSFFRQFLLNHAVPFPLNRSRQHLVVTYKMLLEPLGIPLSNTSPFLYLTHAEKLTAAEKLTSLGIEQGTILIGINPGAAYGSAKCWLPDRYQALSQLLLENSSVKLLFFGDPQGASLVSEIVSKLPKQRAINLAGKTNLRELMAFIQKCNVFLTNDSGPMHVASALGIPLVALFGSTSDVATSPYNGGTVIHKHVPCSPCYRRECPIDFRCMKQIEVDEVYTAIQNLLSHRFCMN